MLTIAPHPLLDLAAFATTFPRPIGEVPVPAWLAELLRPGAAAPFASDDAVRAAIRDLLRHGGYKPTGRGKPSSEYLLRAVADGALTSINAAVDLGNAVSLHSGLPISVVDLDRLRAPLRVERAGAGSTFVFNQAGQSIDLEGLLCLFDAEGPCANAVKDAQRSKTAPGTTRTLSLLWGSKALDDRTSRTTAWYRESLARLDAVTEPVG
jgi:DNA/RNA-binding domain of Phe-tRNA-synthetase-like protein